MIRRIACEYGSRDGRNYSCEVATVSSRSSKTIINHHIHYHQRCYQLCDEHKKEKISAEENNDTPSAAAAGEETGVEQTNYSPR